MEENEEKQPLLGNGDVEINYTDEQTSDKK